MAKKSGPEPPFIHTTHMTNKKQDISTTSVPMTTKLRRMMTYLNELLPNDPLITWRCKIGGSLTGGG